MNFLKKRLKAARDEVSTWPEWEQKCSSSSRSPALLHSDDDKGQEFIKGVVYAAANLVEQHDNPTAAKDILDSVPVLPGKETDKCAEHDLAILRKKVTGWEAVPKGM